MCVCVWGGGGGRRRRGYSITSEGKIGSILPPFRGKKERRSALRKEISWCRVSNYRKEVTGDRTSVLATNAVPCNCYCCCCCYFAVVVFIVVYVGFHWS